MSNKKTTKRVVKKEAEVKPEPVVEASKPEVPVAEESTPEAPEASMVEELTLRGAMDLALDNLEWVKEHPGFMGIKDDGSASDLSIALSKVNSAIVSLGLARDKVQ